MSNEQDDIESYRKLWFAVLEQAIADKDDSFINTHNKHFRDVCDFVGLIPEKVLQVYAQQN